MPSSSLCSWFSSELSPIHQDRSRAQCNIAGAAGGAFGQEPLILSGSQQDAVVQQCLCSPCPVVGTWPGDTVAVEVPSPLHHACKMIMLPEQFQTML